MHEWEDFRISDVSGPRAVPGQALLSCIRQSELQILNHVSSKNNLIARFLGFSCLLNAFKAKVNLKGMLRGIEQSRVTTDLRKIAAATAVLVTSLQ